MIVKIERFESENTRNINGKVIVRNYRYVIAIRRHWYSAKLYLRLTSNWLDKFRHGEPCPVELTSRRSSAMMFKTGKIIDIYNLETAKMLVKAIKENPDRFILN